VHGCSWKVAVAGLASLVMACGGSKSPPPEHEPAAGGAGGAGGEGGRPGDEECVPTLWYADFDQDGLGDPDVFERACRAPADYVANSNDEAPDCMGVRVFYRDRDGDGLGDASEPVEACSPPRGFVNNHDDEEPECETNDSDSCGECGGPGPRRYHPDVDEDGLGDPDVSVRMCEVMAGWVRNGDDPEPTCGTNDTDDCGVCGGEDAAKDCIGVCHGKAELDACGRCTAGTTGLEPAVQDSDGDGIPDECDGCVTEGVPRTIFQWTAIEPYGAVFGGPYTFQAIVFENGDFAYVYRDVEPFGDVSVTVGHQAGRGLRAVELAFGSRYPTAYPIVYFRRQASGTTLVEYTVPLPWIDISTTGTRLTLSDDGIEAVPLPFTFPYSGYEFDSVVVSANGYLGLSQPYIPGENVHLPEVDAGAMLAAFWTDLNPVAGGSIRYQHLSGSCEPDCHGDFGGAAQLDACGVCAGGNTGVLPDADKDCAGVCNGSAYLDVCRTCVGGTTGREPAAEGECLTGPDMLVDERYLRNTIEEAYVDVPTDSCLVNEACVTGTGRRRVVRFGTRIANVGNRDVVIGVPNDANPLWHWDPCHGHFHFEDYANHDLIPAGSNEPLPIGTKNGFCVLDLELWDAELAVNGCGVYDCENQGISVGCADTYDSALQCQWVDITGVPAGEYDLRVTVNPEQLIAELDSANNTATARIQITEDNVQLVE
jgi:hypothetical protein